MRTMDEHQLISLLKTLVSIDSVNPEMSPRHPGEAELASFLTSHMEEIGLQTYEQVVAGDRKNVIGTYGEGEKTLLIVAHMDTVGVDSMDISPFDPVVEGGRLYGRGSSDTKGGMAAALKAVEEYVKGRRPGKIIFAATADEEYEAKGIDRLVEEIDADGALVMEPVGMNIVVAHKGFAWYRFQVQGRAAHGSDFETGVDAIMKAAQLLDEISLLNNRLMEHGHPLLGPPTIHASRIVGGEGWSTYPPSCELQVERRTLPSENKVDVEREIGEVLKRGEKRGINASGELVFYRDATETSPEESIVIAVGRAAESLALSCPRAGMSAWPEAGILNQSGIPSVIIGPSGSRGHEDDEWVELDSVIDCSRLIYHSIINFLS